MSKKKDDQKDHGKDFEDGDTKGGGGMAKVEKLRFHIDGQLRDEYHLTLKPSPNGGATIIWTAPGQKTMGWDGGFAAEYLCGQEIAGFEISISEIFH